MQLKKLLTDEGGFSPKEILSLIQNLPADSRFIAMHRGGLQFWGWSVLEYQMSQLIDAVNDNTVVSARVGGAKKAKPAARAYRPETAKKNKNNQFRSIAARRMAAAKRKKAASNGEGSRRG